MSADPNDFTTSYSVNPADGKPMPNVSLTGSNIMQPMDIQSHLQTTIQTHNAVSVPLSAWSPSATWIDTNGYSDMAVTLLSDVNNKGMGITLFWSNDGINIHAQEELALNVTPPVDGNNTTGLARVTATKARYAKVSIANFDGTAAHTMSAWAYLKA